MNKKINFYYYFYVLILRYHKNSFKERYAKVLSIKNVDFELYKKSLLYKLILILNIINVITLFKFHHSILFH